MENSNNSWLSFFLTKSFYKNLSFSITTVIVIILSILLVLRFYTRHDDLIELPDFSGMDIQETDSILSEKKLRYIANSIKDQLIKKYVLDFFLGKISSLTPNLTKSKQQTIKHVASLSSTKKI